MFSILLSAVLFIIALKITSVIGVIVLNVREYCMISEKELFDYQIIVIQSVFIRWEIQIILMQKDAYK